MSTARLETVEERAAQTWDTATVDAFARQLSADSIAATTAAGSGHPTSAMSSSHILATLLTRHMRLRLDDVSYPTNDRLVLSKGHAAPALYASLVGLGVLEPPSLTELRAPDSLLEGHPVPNLPLIDVATGSLGQGLANGLGMALGLRQLGSNGNVWVIVGDSEMTEGSVWEAMALAHHYKASNLCAIVDMNGLGQTGQTMFGYDTKAYAERAGAFGWATAEVDGHDPDSISAAVDQLATESDRPQMIIARTVKGHGVSFTANKDDLHGKVLDEDEARKAIAELAPPERMVVTPHEPEDKLIELPAHSEFERPDFREAMATRDAFGQALAIHAEADQRVVVVDAEVSNSTMTEHVESGTPGQFIQAYIAEQAMVGLASGLQAVGLKPVVSTFAAFLTRAHDFIRMAAIGRAHMLINGSHAGVSIGEDGPSQMGLEDLAMMRAIPGSTVLCPADGQATVALTDLALEQPGITYIRTARESTPVLYGAGHEFSVGGSHTLRHTPDDVATLVAAGVTVHQALQAADRLAKHGLPVGVVDAYSIQPIDRSTLQRAGNLSGWVVTVEDHYSVGGLGDAVLDALADNGSIRVTKLAASQIPGSAPPDIQREKAGISADAIVDLVRREAE